MASISVSTGKKEIEIIRDGENVGSIYFSPSDTALLARLSSAKEKIKEIADGIKTKGEDMEEVFASLREADKKLRDLLDYAFDYPVSDVVLGNSFSFTTVSGVSVIEQFLDGAMSYINAELRDEKKKAKARTDKYLTKYKK